MSSVDMIKTAIARIKSAKEKLRTWLTSNGVTVPDGTKLDGMVEMLDDVSVSSGDDWEIKDASHLFYNGARIDSINELLKHCKKVTNAESMFYECRPLTEIHDLVKIDFSETTSMRQMFGNCVNVKSIDLTNFNTSNVTTMSNMFSGCNSIEYIDTSNFNTRSAKDMASMFSGCRKIKYIDLSCFDTSNVTYMPMLFYGCEKLESVDFSTFDTSKVSNDMSSMFYNCIALKDITGFSAMNKAGLRIDFPKGSSSKRYALKRLTFRDDLPDGKYAIRSAINISYCSMERSGFLEMIDTITDVSSLSLSASYKKITITGNPCVTGTLSDGTACDVLTDEDRAIATAKGWTLVE